MGHHPPERIDANEFRVAYLRYERRIVVLTLAIILVPIVSFVGWRLLQPFARPMMEARISQRVANTALEIPPAALTGVILTGLAAWAFRARCAKLRCPHCRSWLTLSGGVTIASGRCGHCGEVVCYEKQKLSTPVVAGEPFRTFYTRDDYRAAIRRCKFALLGGPVLVVVGMLFASTEDNLIPIALPVPDGVISIAGFFAMMLVGYSVLAATSNDPRLACPFCHRPRLHSWLAIATEHCEHCAHYVPFDDSPLRATLSDFSNADQQHLPTIDDYRLAHSRDRRRRLLIATPLVLWLSSLAPLLFLTHAVGVPRFAGEIALITGLLALGGILAASRWWPRPAILRCSHCRAGLTHSWPIVMATRHCSRCGGRLLA